MYPPQAIEQVFDADTLKYLQRKNSGGMSGREGTRYEDYFVVYKLAELAPAMLEDWLIVYFSGQLLTFVDDLIIDIPSEPLQHYQLKNSRRVEWKAGPHPIQDDFANQQLLNQSFLARDSQLYLVVSDPNTSSQLSSCIPPAIAPFSQVLHFPYLPIVDLLAQIADFRDAVVYLSAFEKPQPDKLEYAAYALLGAWLDSSGIVSGQQLLLKAQKQTPQYIRSFEFDLALDPEVEKILSQIEDFKYNLAKGFLHWEYADGLQSGTPPYSIDTDNFHRLQERIKILRPTTFEELEILL